MSYYMLIYDFSHCIWKKHGQVTCPIKDIVEFQTDKCNNKFPNKNVDGFVDLTLFSVTRIDKIIFFPIAFYCIGVTSTRDCRY